MGQKDRIKNDKTQVKVNICNKRYNENKNNNIMLG